MVGNNWLTAITIFMNSELQNTNYSKTLLLLQTEFSPIPLIDPLGLDCVDISARHLLIICFSDLLTDDFYW